MDSTSAHTGKTKSRNRLIKKRVERKKNTITSLEVRVRGRLHVLHARPRNNHPLLLASIRPASASPIYASSITSRTPTLQPLLVVGRVNNRIAQTSAHRAVLSWGRQPGQAGRRTVCRRCEDLRDGKMHRSCVCLHLISKSRSVAESQIGWPRRGKPGRKFESARKKAQQNGEFVKYYV
jgi:hypothetical protein